MGVDLKTYRKIRKYALRDLLVNLTRCVTILQISTLVRFPIFLYYWHDEVQGLASQDKDMGDRRGNRIDLKYFLGTS